MPQKIKEKPNMAITDESVNMEVINTIMPSKIKQMIATLLLLNFFCSNKNLSHPILKKHQS
jgi:hypothetical protein